MLVLGLLVSFVQAQAPSKNIDKEAHKATKDVREEAKDKANKTVSGQGAARLQDLEGDAQSSETKASAKKGKKGVTKGSPNMAPSARVSGDRQLSGTRNTSASPSGKKARKGAFSRVFSRIFGGGEKVDGASAGKAGKDGAAQPASGGQDRPSGGQGYQQPKGDKGAAGPKPQDDGGGR